MASAFWSVGAVSRNSAKSGFILEQAHHVASPHSILRVGGEVEEMGCRFTEWSWFPHMGQFHNRIARVSMAASRQIQVKDLPRPRLNLKHSVLQI